jgi:oligoendopeptidase F
MKSNLRLYQSIILSLFICGFLSGQKAYNNRDEIPTQYKWNLNDIYANWDEWETGLKQYESKMEEVLAYKGKLKEGPENLLKVQKLSDELGIISEHIYNYPQFTRDLDNRNQEAVSKLQRVQILFAKYNTATAWINPELLEIPWTTMEKWLNENKGLDPYRYQITNLYRLQSHVLDASKEEMLSFYSRFNGTPSDIYTNLSAADIDFPTVALSSGDNLKATSGNYFRVLATDRNQEDRRKIFEAHYGTYKKNANTYASIYNSICQKDWSNAQARKYTSCLSASLEGNNIPVSVYENLVNTVKLNTEPLKKYNRLRKKVLGLDKYYSYDQSIPLIEFSKTYPYEEAKEWCAASVAPMGDEYNSKYKMALQNGWVDVFESTGKTPGAYSGSVYGVHPFMLLNYNETLDNVFTLAHELGHTMHTLLANENQPYATANYTLFVAEVASTFNEALLLDYLLDKIKDPKERITMIQQAIRNISGTFYFQVLLADFELQVHSLAEKGEPITSDVLTGIMNNLFDSYYGDSVEKDDFINYVWARIPHFYATPFYVYQYATCFVASSKLFDEYKSAPINEKPKVIEGEINLLKSGGNDYPMEQLKKAGVDLSKPETIKAVVDRMDTLVNLLEQEVNKLK